MSAPANPSGYPSSDESDCAPVVELDLSLPELSTGFGLPLAVDPIIHPVG